MLVHTNVQFFPFITNNFFAFNFHSPYKSSDGAGIEIPVDCVTVCCFPAHPPGSPQLRHSTCQHHLPPRFHRSQQFFNEAYCITGNPLNSHKILNLIDWIIENSFIQFIAINNIIERLKIHSFNCPISHTKLVLYTYLINWDW